MFRIGEFSKMSKTTVKTLRYYDEIGLLKPEEIDKFTGYRFYTTDQLVQLHRIQELKQIGLSINEINLILSGHNCEPILRKRKAELISELAHGQNQLTRIEFILQGENSMNYSATIKELPACIVYSKKIHIPNYNASKYDAYFEIIPEIGKTVTEKYPDLKCATPEYCFIVYPDGEYNDKDINIEFCEAVDKIYPDFDDIKFKEIKACTAVSVMHKGAYNELAKAYAYACKWIEENGYAIADNPRENYIDGVWNKESKEEWLTEIQVPIIKK